MKRKKVARVKAAAAAPAPPAPMSAQLRQSVQGLLARIEQTTPALRQSGSFELLGLLAQAGHALKLVADHAHALERALGLVPEPPPAAPPKPHSNGVAP
jgi:hypothetical protein